VSSSVPNLKKVGAFPFCVAQKRLVHVKLICFCYLDESDTFTTRLVAKVVANLQLFIEKIHIRYEDDTQNQQVP